jgi:hypothetical protein
LKLTKHITAFTLFETTIVLAIMGVLISIVFLSLNRFNEQLKLNSAIQSELNNWYRFRSNLWKELYHSDSLRMEMGSVHVHIGERTVAYKIEDDTLYRKGVEDWESTGFAAETIRMEEMNEDREYFFDFTWKGEIMTLSYIDHKTPKEKIDSYFEAL